MTYSNEDIKELRAEIPDGHQHIRVTIVLQDGSEMTFQEATVASLVRAYIAIKTHPSKARLILKGARLDSRKEGYAEWQLIESPGDR